MTDPINQNLSAWMARPLFTAGEPSQPRSSRREARRDGLRARGADLGAARASLGASLPSLRARPDVDVCARASARHRSPAVRQLPDAAR